jgi:hypothetical protein
MFDLMLRALHAHAFDGFGWRGRCRCTECAAELPDAQMRDRGEMLDTQRLPQVFAGVAEHTLDPIRERVLLQEQRLLRLITGSAHVNDEHTRDSSRDLSAQILFDQRE